MKYSLYIVWLFAILLIISIFVYPEEFFAIGTNIIGWFLFALSYTYNKSDRFFLFTNRLAFFIKNPDCIWNLEIKLTNVSNVNLLDTLEKNIISKFNDDNVKITPLSKTRRQYKVGTFIFDLFVNTDDKYVIFSMYDLEVSYKRANIIFDGKLNDIINEVRKITTPDNEKYSVKIGFQHINPYFGLFVKKLQMNKIDYFNVKFQFEQNNVSVYRNSIEINSSNYENLIKTAKSYLTLSAQV